jgi:hypothetical protein
MNHSQYSSTAGTIAQLSTALRVLEALAPYKLKQEKPNQYRCHSPLRPGSDSHAFVLILDDDGEHGAYFDHAHEEDHGSLYDLATRLGIGLPPASPPSPRQPIQSTKRVYSGLVDYAEAHGVAAEIFAAAGWSETTYQDRPALAFATQTGIRYRFLDGDKPTYKSQPGYQRCWYGLKRAVQLAEESGQALVICNGEASTVVGQHFGLAACVVTAGEQKELSPDLLDELKAVYAGPIIIAFDCLDKGADVAPILAAQLKTASFAARAVDLGLDKGGDVADFCRLHGSQAAAALAILPNVQAAPPAAPGQGWQWIHADHLDKLPPIRWLIPGEIPEQALVVLFGQSGAGKSFIALDYSLRIAQQHPVLYIAAEGYAGYANRKIAWCKHHGLGAGKLYFPHDNTVIGLLDPKVVQAFIASVTPLRPKLIVFDTLAWCMTGGDENSTGDMQRLITHCRQIQTVTGATVLLVHHTGKTGVSERGSSALRGGADMMIEVSNDDDLITLSCSKSKETEGFDDRHLARLTIDTRPGETSCVWLPTDKVAHSKTNRLTRQQREVLETLNSPLFAEVGARFSQLADALPDISRSGLYKILNRLMDTRVGYITQGKKGEPFTITEAGRTALSTAGSGSPGGKSTVSTLSLPLSTETPSLQSTLSTPPEGGRQRLDVDSGGQVENAPPGSASAPTLSAVERATLQAWADYARSSPTAFHSAHQVFPNPDQVRLQTLVRLHAQGYLEREHSTGHTYRLSSAGWAALGLRLVDVDLRNL